MVIELISKAYRSLINHISTVFSLTNIAVDRIMTSLKLILNLYKQTEVKIFLFIIPFMFLCILVPNFEKQELYIQTTTLQILNASNLPTPLNFKFCQSRQFVTDESASPNLVLGNPTSPINQDEKNRQYNSKCSNSPSYFEINAYTIKNVRIGNSLLLGADGHPITLMENPKSENTTWENLVAFLHDDQTDTETFDEKTFVCSDFAEMLHNRAESAGIKCAYVTVDLGPSQEYPEGIGHALNAFQTTDQGCIYIDSTHTNRAPVYYQDKKVLLVIGQPYVPQSLFKDDHYEINWGNMGTVKTIEVVQW